MSAPRTARPWAGRPRPDGDTGTEARAPWSGLRSPSAWCCPNCDTAAAPDPTQSGVLVARHRETCPNRRPDAPSRSRPFNLPEAR
ncbi:hypothetical protein [Frankia sp. CiP1_Cm_nod2]|uniref:hypothetical protein n=1 Tax=Frankia sp. CiP1_Cm_nod2 TaxID=2897161 RepID=UPI002024D203